MKMTNLLVMLILLGSSFCASSQSKKLAVLTAHDKENWHDLLLSITEKEKLPTGFWKLQCQATYKGAIVGFTISILDEMQPGIVGYNMDDSRFMTRVVTIQSNGEQSDRFIKAVSELYKQPVADQFTTSHLTFDVFPVNTKVAKLDAGKFKFNLFYDESNELDLFTELYLIVNMPAGTIEFTEKDEKYRRNFVKMMTMPVENSSSYNGSKLRR